jgi:hypothetical protein
MSDAICRWRNPFLINVRFLIDCLPKSIMEDQKAKEYVAKIYGKNFFKTPYQSACQLGLYYIENNLFYPKFTYDPSVEEIQAYLDNWILHYPIPNPYTKGFQQIKKPFSIHDKLCKLLEEYKQPVEWKIALSKIFEEGIDDTKNKGNKDILKNCINRYSKLIRINRDNILELKPGINYLDLKNNSFSLNFVNKNDKKSFFNLFSTINEEITNELNELLDTLSDLQEKDINTFRNLLIKARLGQSKFRNDLLNSNKNTCIFTGVREQKLLIAGHIKPWSTSLDPEKIDINNGILLTPTFDKLFDKFLISFDTQGKVMYSSEIENDVWNSLFPTFENVKNIHIVINDNNKDYLEFHRNKFKNNK